MKKIPIVATLCLAVLAAPFLSLAEEAKSYALKLHRPCKVGQKTHDSFRLESIDSHKVTQGGNALKEESTEIRVEMSGITEVKEVTAEGKAVRISFTVEKCTLTTVPAAETGPIQPGTVIEAEGMEGRKKKLTVAGKELTGPTAEALKQFFQISSPNKKEPDDDAVYGSVKPRAPGSEWDVNAKALVETSEDTPVVLKEQDVKGKVKFTRLVNQGGVPCCELKMEMTMSPSSVKGMPPGFTLAKSNNKIIGERLVPVSSAGIIPVEKLKVQMDFTGSIPSANGPVNLESVSSMAMERASKPAK